MKKLEFKNINFAYGSNEIYHNLNLSINDHEFVAIVGPSGVGKTTLLRLIAGFEDTSMGTILYNNRELTALDKTNMSAMVFQNYGLFKSMRVKDNIKYGLKLKKISNDEKNKKVNEVASSLEIDSLLNRYPSQLSGGECQRVGLARALVREPKFFLFDEPLSNLDASLKQSMRTVIKSIYEKSDAIFLYVTHDQVEAMELATKILLLSKKGIEEYASPNKIYNNPKNLYVASFFGEPKINILNGKIIKQKNAFYIEYNHELIKLPNESYNYQILKRYQNKKIIFAVRPENIVFSNKGLTYKLLSSEYLGKYYKHKVMINHDEVTIIGNELLENKIMFNHIFLFDSETKENIMY